MTAPVDTTARAIEAVQRMADYCIDNGAAEDAIEEDLEWVDSELRATRRLAAENRILRETPIEVYAVTVIDGTVSLNIAIAPGTEDLVHRTHTMTPASARALATNLLERAEAADALTKNGERDAR